MAKFLISKGLQSAYDVIVTKNQNTIYVCTDSGNMYLGDTPLYEEGSFINAELTGKTLKFTKKDSTNVTVDLSTFATSDEVSSSISSLVKSVKATENSGIAVGGTATDPTIGIKLNGDTLLVGAEGLSVNSSKFDAAGKADAIKVELIGSDSDNSSSNTIYGAKKYADEKITAQIASTYRYKGSCTYEELPAEENQIGDVWNVTDAHGNVPAGTNYAWDGMSWDALAGVVDLTPYARTEEVASTYATKSEVTSGLESKVDKTTTINSKPLSSNVTLAGGDVALTGYNKGSDKSTITAEDTVNSAIAKLENRVADAETGGVTSVTAEDKSINVSASTGAVNVKVNISATGENALTLASDGLRVAPMEWGEF